MNQFLSKEELQNKVPSAFATSGCATRTSKHYAHLSTIETVDTLEGLGWMPIKATQTKVNKKYADTLEGYQTHCIHFAHQEQIQVSDSQQVGTLLPRIIMLNNHMGTLANRIEFGLYRLVCSNGLVIPQQEFEWLKVRHQGITIEIFKEMIRQYIQSLPKTLENIKMYQDIKLSAVESARFAREALELKYTNGKYQIMPETLLIPRRTADEGNDLWTIFNVVQENMFKGGQRYSSEKRKAKTRGLNSIYATVDLNKALWELMIRYSRIKG
jgi:hypothetical protein